MPNVKLNAEQADSLECRHVDQAHEVNYSERVCPECMKLGDSWVHLRICLVCGHVGSAALPRTGAQGGVPWTSCEAGC